MGFFQRILGAVAITSAVSRTSASKVPTATTLNGTYSGIYNAIYGVESFLGIPYAKPPIESLRFSLPQSLNTSWENTRQAIQYGNQCVGYGVGTLKLV
jgi:carboxylesterase type B